MIAISHDIYGLFKQYNNFILNIGCRAFINGFELKGHRMKNENDETLENKDESEAERLRKQQEADVELITVILPTINNQ